MEIVQELAAIGGVLALLAATLWWLRKPGFAAIGSTRRNSGRKLECLERLSLGPRQTLHLVRMGDRALLLASTPAGCSLLERMAYQELEAPREAFR